MQSKKFWCNQIDYQVRMYVADGEAWNEHQPLLEQADNLVFSLELGNFSHGSEGSSDSIEDYAATEYNPARLDLEVLKAELAAIDAVADQLNVPYRLTGWLWLYESREYAIDYIGECICLDFNFINGEIEFQDDEPAIEQIEFMDYSF